MRHRQQGFSLLEVMIAGLVSALGLAGTAALLLFSLAQTSAARDRTVAARMTADLAEIMLIAPAAWQDASHPSELGAGFASHELAAWQLRINATLPGGQGLVCRDGTPFDGSPALPACDDAGAWVVKVFWKRSDNGLWRRSVLAVPL